MLRRLVKRVGGAALGLAVDRSRATKRIAFIHIPKCAGSSVAEAIRRTYFPLPQELHRRWSDGAAFASVAIGPEASLATAEQFQVNLQHFRSMVLYYELSLARTAYVTGHVPFSKIVADAHADRWSFVTTLRNPIDRFFSEYFYNRFKASGHYKVNDELDMYLQSADARRTSSQLINFLTGRPDVYSPPSQHDVESALDNLRRFAVVGFVEDLERFAHDLATHFGKRPVFERTNKSPAPEGKRRCMLDRSIREKVVELNAADTEIYIRARKLFGGASDRA